MEEYKNQCPWKVILDSYALPRVDTDGSKVSESRMYKLTEKEIRLKLDGTNAEERRNVIVLGLEDVYSKHGNYVKELIDKSMAYDSHARRALVDSFQGAGYHPRQVYDFVWGRHLSDAEYEDRPLSKLTKDMLDLLGIRRGWFVIAIVSFSVEIILVLCNHRVKYPHLIAATPTSLVEAAALSLTSIEINRLQHDSTQAIGLCQYPEWQDFEWEKDHNYYFELEKTNLKSMNRE